jgi:hypothetical protein
VIKSTNTWLALTLAVVGCGGDDEGGALCTLELRLPIAVRVSSPQGLPIDTVTARNREIEQCSSFGFEDAGDDRVFHCAEQGGGKYVVRVASGELAWSQSVDLTADACHVSDSATLEFVLDPATAD